MRTMFLYVLCLTHATQPVFYYSQQCLLQNSVMGAAIMRGAATGKAGRCGSEQLTVK